MRLLHLVPLLSNVAPSCFREAPRCLLSTQASPLDEECESEGAVVCHQGRIKGRPGVAMDDLVYICTKIARQMDAQASTPC